MDFSHLLISDPQSLLVSRDTCLVCGNHQNRYILDLDLSAMDTFWQHPKIQARRYIHHLKSVCPFQVYECPRCGFIWQRNVLRSDAETWLYQAEPIGRGPGSRAAKYRSGGGEFTYYKSLNQVASGIYYLFRKNPGEIKILDFGAGWGDFTLIAKSFGYDVCVCEVDDDKINYFENMNIKNITIPSKQKFDFIFTSDTFEHISEVTSVLRLLLTQLKEAGYIYISVPTVKSNRIVKDTSAALLKAIRPFEHINIFSPKSLRLWGIKNGLKPAHFGGYLIETRERFNYKSIIKQYILKGWRSWFTTNQLFKKQTS